MTHKEMDGIYAAKETNNKMERQPTKWEKILTNHISDKRLVSRKHKELSKLYIEQQIIQLKNGQKMRTDISLKRIHRWPISTENMFNIIIH